MSYRTNSFTQLNYGQFLLSGQIDYSLNYFADHAKKWSRHTFNRYLEGEKITTRLFGEKVRDQPEPFQDGYRICDPDADGKSKIDHLHEMLTNTCHQKTLHQETLPFQAVLIDTWYASRKMMRHIERLEKIYYCPIKTKRLVDETGGTQPHDNADNLTWDAHDQAHGKTVHLKNFQKGIA